MFWKMVWGAMFRQKSKMLMIAFTVALGISLATAMVTVMLGVGDKINRELKTYGANIHVVPKNASLLDDLYGISNGEGIEDQYLNEKDAPKIKQIFWGFNILTFAPYLNTNATFTKENQQVSVIGTWFDRHLKLSTGEDAEAGIKLLKNWWTVDGEWLKDDSKDQAMVGSLFAGRNNIKLNDEITLKTQNKEKKFKVVGIFNAGSEEDNKIYLKLKDAQELANLSQKISSIDVSALTTPDNELAKKASQNPNSLTPSEYETWYCTAYVSSISYQIQEAVSNSVAKAVRQVAQSEGTILNKTQFLMLLITILSSIGSALGISNLITAAVMERSQEIGLMKAIGGRAIRIVLITLSEIFLTGLIGGIFGYLAGIGFAQIIGLSVFDSTISIPTMVIPIDILILICVIFVGSLPSIRYLFKLKPTEVLHGR